MAEKRKVLTGARARFSIDGVKVGYARNVTLGEGVTYENLEVMDNIEVEEHVPTGYEVQNFTASMFRIIGTSVKSLGWFPKNGANSEEHLENILTSGELSATLEDSSTGKIFAAVEQVKVASHNFSVDARGIIGSDVTFVAIRLKDESEI